MMKGERLAKRTSLGNMMRKRLSDISNLQTQPKLLSLEEKAPPGSPSSMDYVEHLLEENKTLMELVEQRNKVIASTGAELQKLRTNYQKLQQQNWNLAQSNSHYLAELNLGREKLKALQHELICKDALLRAKKLEGGEEATEQPLAQTNVAEKHGNSHNQRRISRSQSLGPTTNQQVAEKERIENKRRRLRRQSHSSKPEKHEASENLFEIEDVKFPISKPCDSPMHVGSSLSMGSSVKREEEKERNHNYYSPRTKASQRASIGRPLRRAAEKVQSYKEVPVNIKMRRPEWA